MNHPDKTIHFPDHLTDKYGVQFAPPQMQESNPFSSLLAPKPQRPLIGSFSGEWNWQSFQVYQNALTMAAVEQAIADRNLALSSPKSLDFSDPSRAIESAHKEIWGEWFFDRNFEVLDVIPYSAGDNSASSIPLWLRGFAGPDHLSYDPQERVEMNSQCLVAMAHSAGRIIGEAIDELRTLGSVSSSIRSDGKITLQFDRTVSQKIEGFLNEHLPNYRDIEGFHLVQNTSDIMTGLVIDAFAMPFFARFLATGAHSLQGQSLITARQGATGLSGLSEQAAFLRGMNTPVYRSGLGYPMNEMVAVQPRNLVGRNVSRIRTDWVFPKKGGAIINGRWYTEHALERMAPRTPEVMAELEVRALDRAAKKGYKPQTKAFGDWWKDHKPNPRNIPPSVVESEIANPGSTNIRVEINKKGDVITVIPVGQK